MRICPGGLGNVLIRKGPVPGGLGSVLIRWESAPEIWEAF